MDRAEIGNGKLRIDVALRMQSRVQCRVIECLRFTVRQPGVRGGGQIVRHRALGDAQCGGDLRIGQRAFVLETQNFSNSSHGNPVGWHPRLPEQKGASVPSRRFELPRTATSPLRSRPRFPGIVTAVPTNLTAISDVPAKAVTIRRIHRSTSSDSAVIIRRKPRSRSVGIHTRRLWKVRRYVEWLGQMLCEQGICFESLHIKFHVRPPSGHRSHLCEKGRLRIDLLEWLRSLRCWGGHACRFLTNGFDGSIQNLC